MKRNAAALLLLAAWAASLVVLGAFVARHLTIDADLRLFLPKPRSAEQRLLLEGIGEGPAARLLVIALAGAELERLVTASRGLTERLRDSEYFRLVSNGDLSFDSFRTELLPYRFLLSPTLDRERLERAYLQTELEARIRDLASPAALVLEPLLARDPTLELLRVLQIWQPAQEPNRSFDVWFDQRGERALLIAETSAPAFDSEGQRAALDALERALASASEGERLDMTVTGPGVFSVLMEARTRAEARTLGQVAMIGMIVLLLVVYRRVGYVVLSALPLVSGGLAGLFTIGALFGTVHGITLAFGFTLIGVAQDYPLHLLSHQRSEIAPRDVARQLWPTLATGMASTCIAYLTFLFSGVTGLAQLACFTVAGLAAAGLTTRYLLPGLISQHGPDRRDSALLGRIWTSMQRLPRLRYAGISAIALCAGIATLSPQSLWDNDLAALTPVPADVLERDRELRAELGTPDVRYMLALSARDEDIALSRLEAVDAELLRLVERGTITGYDHAARYLPSLATQRARQQRLPDAETLRAELSAAQSGTAFRPNVFEPFIADVALARDLPPLTVEQIRSSPVGARFETLLVAQDESTTALVTLSGVRDVAALTAFAATQPDVRFVDLKEAAESLVAMQRTRILWSLIVAFLLLASVVAFALRSRARVIRVLAPMLLSTLVIVAALQVSGVSLNLFHLIALILAAGLGLDYALFFDRAAGDPAEQTRTLHALLACSVSTLFVFALLATSTLPVLRAIGTPVAIGTVANFVLALLLTQQPLKSLKSAPQP